MYAVYVLFDLKYCNPCNTSSCRRNSMHVSNVMSAEVQCSLCTVLCSRSKIVGEVLLGAVETIESTALSPSGLSTRKG